MTDSFELLAKVHPCCNLCQYFLSWSYSPLCIHHILFTHSSVGIWITYYFLVNQNNATLNFMWKFLCRPMFLFLLCMYSSGAAGSHVHPMFSYLVSFRLYSKVFLLFCIFTTSMRTFQFSTSFQSIIWLLKLWTGVRWRRLVVLFSAPLKVRAVEQSFECLLATYVSSSLGEVFIQRLSLDPWGKYLSRDLA